jgi:hypothetical protein
LGSCQPHPQLLHFVFSSCFGYRFAPRVAPKGLPFQKLKRCKECSRFFIADRLSESSVVPNVARFILIEVPLIRVRESRANKRAERKHSKKRRRPATVKGKRRKHGPNV